MQHHPRLHEAELRTRQRPGQHLAIRDGDRGVVLAVERVKVRRVVACPRLELEADEDA